ncbi:CHAT domain-containing protein [Aquimarina sp. LLG6339-5]|uniref:CHAT domain-containing protein n=1 Tax=Aquimarina sp. LLG6339-5 TaxID=3160830 RepID=UPI00386534EC
MERLEYLFYLKILCFFILVIPFYKVSAQSAQDSILAAKYLKKAESLLAEKKLERSVIYFKKALDVELKIYGQNHEKTIIYYDRIGLIYKNIGQHEIALDYFKTFLNLAIKRYGRYHFYAGYGFLNIGVTYKNLFQYDLALENYEKSLITFQYLRKKDMTAFIYDNIGVVFTKNGENTKAIEYYDKSIKIGTKLFGENYIENGKSYQNIGALYSNKQEYEKSLSYYQKSIAVYINAYGQNNLKVAKLYSDIGDIYNRKKEYDISLDYYQKSLEAYSSILDLNDPKIINLNLRIASIYIRKKKFEEAIKYYEKGLNTFKETYGTNHLLTSDFYYNIAKAYDKKKDFNTAITYYNKAVIANKKDQSFNNNETFFDPSEYYDLKLLLTVLHGKAKTLQSKYIENENIEDLCISLKIYEEADILIDYIRKSYQNYQDKIAFASSAREVYSDAIKTQFLFYKEIEEQQTLEKIIYYIEKSKANTLKDLINESKTKEFAGLSKELLELEKNQRINRAFYQSRIIEEKSKSAANNSRIQEYENKLSRLKNMEDSLTTIIKNNYPKYHRLKYQNTIILVEDIQKTLKGTTTLLEFFVSDDIIYAFIITKNKIEVKELNTSGLEEKIQEFRRTITNKQTLEYKTVAYGLYQDLIAPLKHLFTGNELIIVPDGALWHLNFDLLLSKKDNTNNPKELSYLLKEHIISYANSVNLLLAPREKSVFNFTQMQKECLAFSFSNSNDQQNSNTISLSALTEYENDLPGTRKEIKSIANIINGNYFYGLEAVEKNFKKNVSQYNILHLALHGEVDNEKPENSKLFFTQSNDSIEDDLLHSHELFALNIPAELTVLSACNTGTGKIAKGEGIMSLGTAFQYAGAKSLLLSSWEVSDQTTPDLMKYFYTNLKEGMSKAEALQQAKLQYLNNANINRIHPFYWGGFYVLGDTTPIQFNSYYNWYWSITIVSILILLILGYLWYKKKKQTL